MESKQPTFNIGMVGHVAHGKSSTVKALTGIETFKHAKEKERGITIKIGYANCKIFKCPKCSEPECYHSAGSATKKHLCNHCGNDTELVRYFSFVDCPGHESLMNTMLSGTTVMDYAILLIDGSQKCPQLQTVEHLAALEILQIKKIIIIQNKLDLIDGNKAQEQYDDIKKFVKGTCAESAPIIPMSAQKRYNLDVLCEFIIKYFNEENSTTPTIPKESIIHPKMNIIRSFDINKPGSDINLISGGVLGGTLIEGNLRVGDLIEIRPGIVRKNNQGLMTWKPITTEIISMKSDSDQLDIASPGGLIGICTNLDPVLTRSDRMVGQVVGHPGFMPEVYLEISAKCIFMKLLPKTDTNNSITSDIKIIKPIKGDNILLNIASKPVIATVQNLSKNKYSLTLQQPCCIDVGEKFSISTKLAGSWRLIGMGELIN